MSRIQKAQEAYKTQDKVKMQEAHTKEAIAESINHTEGHKTDFNLPEIILGGQDGLVNVLGVILGVVAATGSNSIVIVAGLAATFAESISMGAVAYTSKLAEADYYQSEYEREQYEIEHEPEGEREEVRQIYTKYGFSGEILDKIVEQITSNKETWTQVMMEQELKLEPINRKDAIPAAFIVGFSALVGSFIPLTPYFFLPIKEATMLALILSALTLFVVGWIKAEKTIGRQMFKAGIEMTIIGMVSAFIGYFIGFLLQVG